MPCLGVVVAISWMLSLDSMTGRLSAKHAVLVDLESRLPFDFFRQENEGFEKGGFVRRKWSRTRAGRLRCPVREPAWTAWRR